jgi:transcriptional regulator with XRE-family HTH domain
MSTFGEKMLVLMAERNLSLRRLAAIVHYNDGYLSRISRDLRVPSAEVASRLDEALDARGELTALVQAAEDSAGPHANVKGTRTPDDEDEDEDEDDEMQRRRLLQALAALGVTSSPAFDALRHIRAGMDRAVGRDEGSHLDELEEVVADYNHTYLVLPPQALIRELAPDLVNVQQITAKRYKGQPPPGWCRVTAGLSAIMAKTLCNLRQPRIAREWWSTAQHAADVSGDRDLVLWIGAERLVNGLYERRPTTLLLRRADELVGHAPATPCRGLVHVRTVRAQLLALERSPADADAELRACAEIFQAMPGTITGDVHTLEGWAEDRLHYTEAWVRAHTGDRDGLDDAVARAHQVLPDDEPRVHAQLRLLHASGHVRAGDVTEGVKHAHNVYAAQPVEQRTSMVTGLARLVLEAVPVRSADDQVVVGYRELLASEGGCKSIT